MANILLIEDDELSRMTFRKFLESAGHGVTEAGDGEEGLCLREAQTFDLIVTDIIMPVKEGISTIVELKKLHPEQKIIAVTGGGSGILIGGETLDSAAEFYGQAAKKLGADIILLKPFTEGEFLAAVDACLSS